MQDLWTEMYREHHSKTPKAKTKSINENESKENKNVDEFQEYILQQKPEKTKVRTQSGMKAWNAI